MIWPWALYFIGFAFIWSLFFPYSTTIIMEIPTQMFIGLLLWSNQLVNLNFASRFVDCLLATLKLWICSIIIGSTDFLFSFNFSYNFSFSLAYLHCKLLVNHFVCHCIITRWMDASTQLHSPWTAISFACLVLKLQISWPYGQAMTI